MDLSRALAEQLARPSGRAGRWLGGAMDLANRRPTQLALDLLAPRDGERILDAGCGTGAAMAEVLRRADCRMTGVDRSESMLVAARRRLGWRARLHCAGIEDLPIPDGGFDAVLALNVLYFADPEGRMLASLARLLRPGGRLVAYVTHRDTMQGWRFARRGLHRLYDEAGLVDAIAVGGFAREHISVHAEPVTRSVKGLLALARR